MAVNKEAMFWTDARQAQERLNGSTVLYDGTTPVTIRDIIVGEEYEDRVPRVRAYVEGQRTKTFKLDDEKFNKFRQLPRLGWINSTLTASHPCAAYLERTARNTRTHGLSDGNTVLYDFQDGNLEKSRHYMPSQLFLDSSFTEAQQKDGYPSLTEIVGIIQNRSAIAYNSKFCVYRCKDGVRWLYRKRERIGLFTGADSLSLFSRNAYYREEIMDDPAFTFNTIQEF